MDMSVFMFIAIPSIVIFFVTWKYLKFRRFFSKGVDAIATLDAIETRYDEERDEGVTRSVKRFYPIYSYKTLEGQEMRGTPFFYIHRSKNGYSLNDNPNIGTQLPMKYLPDEPKRFILTDRKSLYNTISFGLFFIIVAIILVSFRFGFSLGTYAVIGFHLLMGLDLAVNNWNKKPKF